MPREVCIELAPSAVDHPFAEMMATLLRQNLDDHPRKAALALTLEGAMTLVVADLDVRVTLVFERGRIVVHGDLFGLPDVTIRATSELVPKLSLLELVKRGPFHLPDSRGAVAKELAAAEERGELSTYASLSATRFALGVTDVLSIH